MISCYLTVFFILIAMLLVDGGQVSHLGLQTPKAYNGGRCTADKHGVMRIALQYCDGSNWLSMEPAQKTKNAYAPKGQKGALGTSCYDILKKGRSKGNGDYLIDPDGDGVGKPFQVHCDMSSFGGGWTMCYTTDSLVDIKAELATKSSIGYRADCNNIPFTEVMFVDEKSKEKAAFKKTGSPIKFIDNYNKPANTYGQWDAQGVAPTKYKYQLLICDMSFFKGLHISGYTKCYKKCDNWCGDTASPYFRSASSNKSYNGVAFNENGHKPKQSRLISAGIR